jgi:hypothetical protein
MTGSKVYLKERAPLRECSMWRSATKKYFFNIELPYMNVKNTLSGLHVSRDLPLGFTDFQKPCPMREEHFF